MSEATREAGLPPAEVVWPRRRRARGRFGDARLLVAVFAGGVAGALLRAGVSEAFPAGAGAFPWDVFGVNVGGTVLLAYLAIRLQERLPPSTYRRPLVGTGFCGALTTFSTLQVQVVELGGDGHVVTGVLYLAGSIAAGLVAAVATVAATRRARLR